MMPPLTYQAGASLPLSTVMAGLVVLMPMDQRAEPIAPVSSGQGTPTIRSSYLPGNMGTPIWIQTTLTGDPVVDTYRPRTELGRKLIALRRAYVTTGGQLLDSDALDAEIRSRRGGR